MELLQEIVTKQLCDTLFHDNLSKRIPLLLQSINDKGITLRIIASALQHAALELNINAEVIPVLLGQLDPKDIKTALTSKNDEGNSALMIAVRKKNVKIIRALLEGLRIAVKLHYFQDERAYITELLLKETQDNEQISVITDKNPELSPLFCAATKNEESFIEELLKGLKEEDKQVLIAEVIHDNQEILRNTILTKKHKDLISDLGELSCYCKKRVISSTPKNGIPLLSLALYTGNLSVVKAFLESLNDDDKKISTNQKGPFGTPFSTYMLFGNNLDIVEYLLQNGADINIKDDLGVTAIQLAMLMGSKEIVDLIHRTEVIKRRINKAKSVDDLVEFIEEKESETASKKRSRAKKKGQS